MSWLLDVIIVLILFFTIYFSYKRGFVRTLVSTCAFIIALVVTAMFAQPLTDFLKGTAFARTIEETTESKIVSIMEEGAYEFSDLINGESEEFNKITDLAGIDRGKLTEFVELQHEAKQERIRRLSENVAKPMIDTAAKTIAVVSIYLVVQIALSVGGYFLDKLAHLPILKTFNTLFGVILGVVLGLLRACLFCVLVAILIKVGAYFGNVFLTSLNPEETEIFKYLSDFNIFYFFI